MDEVGGSEAVAGELLDLQQRYIVADRKLDAPSIIVELSRQSEQLLEQLELVFTAGVAQVFVALPVLEIGTSKIRGNR